MPQQKKLDRAAEFIYIPCRVEPGMFRGEWLVYLDAFNPYSPAKAERVQLFADQRDVSGIAGQPERQRPAEALLRASLLGASGDKLQVVLPQPSHPFGPLILVDKAAAKKESGL